MPTLLDLLFARIDRYFDQEWPAIWIPEGL